MDTALTARDLTSFLCNTLGRNVLSTSVKEDLQATMAQDQLDLGLQMQIIVTHIIDPLNFYSLFGTEKTLEVFREFEAEISKDCEGRDDRADITQLCMGQVVLYYCDKLQKWIRATVNTIDIEEEEVDVMAGDYRFTEYVTADKLISTIPEKVLQFPVHTYPCRLSDVQPIANKWIIRAVNRFSQLVLMKTLSVFISKVSDNNSNTLEVEILVDIDDKTVKSIGEMLKDEDLAMACPSPTVSPLLRQDSSSGASSPLDSSIPGFDTKQLTKELGPRKPRKKKETRSIEEELHRSALGGDSGYVYEKTDHLIARGQLDPGSSGDVFGSIRRMIQEVNQAKQEDHQKASGDEGVQNGGRRHNSPGYKPRRDGQLFKGRPNGRNYTPPDQRLSRPDSCSPRPHSNSPVDRRYQTVPATKRDNPAGVKRPPQREGRGRAERGKRYGPTPAASMREKLQNEYMWQSDQFSRKVRELLQEIDETNILEKLEEMNQIVYPDQSTLHDLPGPQELAVALETALKAAISDWERWKDMIVPVLATFQADETFSSVISERLWKLQGEYVKFVTHSQGKKQCQNFCKLLGHLYVAANDWDDSGSVHVCVLNMIEKWAIFNKRNHQRDQVDLMAVYAECLYTFLAIAGRAIEKFVPSELQQLLKEIKDKVLCANLPRPIREQLLKLLILRETQWIEKQKKEGSEGESESDAVAQPPPSPETCDMAVNTSIVEIRDVGVQVEFEQPPISVVSPVQAPMPLVKPEAYDHSNKKPYDLDFYGHQVKVASPANLHQHHPQLQFGVVPPMMSAPYTHSEVAAVETLSSSDLEFLSEGTEEAAADPYRKVKAMLRDLDLDGLLEVFISNVIRDSLLDQDFIDLKEVLKDCGMKPGQVLEIQTYLKKKAQMERENPIPPSPVAAPVSAAARPPPSAAARNPLPPTAAVFMPSTAVPKPEPQLLPQAREARVERPAPTAENPPLESPNITLISPSMFEQHHAEAQTFMAPGSDCYDHYTMIEPPHTSLEDPGSIYLAQQQKEHHKRGMAANLQEKPMSWRELKHSTSQESAHSASSADHAVDVGATADSSLHGHMTVLKHHRDLEPLGDTSQTKSQEEQSTPAVHPRERYSAASCKSTVQDWLSGKPNPPVTVPSQQKQKYRPPPPPQEAEDVSNEEFPPLQAVVSLAQDKPRPAAKDASKIEVNNNVADQKLSSRTSPAKPKYQTSFTSAAPPEANVKNMFGRSSRVCPICGSKSHSSDECSERKKKFFM